MHALMHMNESYSCQGIATKNTMIVLKTSNAYG